MSDFAATGVPTTLAVPSVIGVVGDVHGSVQVMVEAAKQCVAAGADQVHFLGDVALPWADTTAEWRAVAEVSSALRQLGVDGVITGGNHENYDLLRAIRPSADGVRAIADNVLFLPRGWRAETPGGRVVASLGGAVSVDRDKLRPHVEWWPDEAITETDLAVLGSDRVDVLLGHEAPTTAALSARLSASAKFLPAESGAAAEAGRRMFDRGVAAVRPQLVISGHHHTPIDVVERFESANGWFQTRSLVLAADGRRQSTALVWLDLPDGPEIEHLSPRLSASAPGWAQ